ncbi:MAG: ribosomal protein L7/L12, partial [Deltaproteobacteria bacterium]|nr:ribosomal protein L7/L12 [Deltaproteobacteria bacterium]
MPEIDIKGSYSVIITGLRSDSQEVKKKFIFGMNKIFKVSPNKVERILESCPRLVKRDLDKEKAEKLKEILEKIGAVVEIRTPLINEETTSTMTFAEEITELMEGSKKDKEGEKEDKKEDLDKKQTTSTITLGKRVDFDKSPQYK